MKSILLILTIAQALSAFAQTEETRQWSTVHGGRVEAWLHSYTNGMAELRKGGITYRFKDSDLSEADRAYLSNKAGRKYERSEVEVNAEQGKEAARIAATKPGFKGLRVGMTGLEVSALVNRDGWTALTAGTLTPPREDDGLPACIAVKYGMRMAAPAADLFWHGDRLAQIWLYSPHASSSDEVKRLKWWTDAAIEGIEAKHGKGNFEDEEEDYSSFHVFINADPIWNIKTWSLNGGKDKVTVMIYKNERSYQAVIKYTDTALDEARIRDIKSKDRNAL